MPLPFTTTWEVSMACYHIYTEAERVTATTVYLLQPAAYTKLNPLKTDIHG